VVRSWVHPSAEEAGPRRNRQARPWGRDRAGPLFARVPDCL